MKLSILDQVVIAEERSAQEAIQETQQLAIVADKLGYSRYWIAEHHDLPGLACPAPEVLLGLIGSKTSQMRIGAGAVLLPNYQPYRVAETYNLLATMFPGRIDIGLGRSPGGSAEASQALNSNMLQAIYSMPQKVEELLHFINRDFPTEHVFSSLQASPVPEVAPVPWILGTSVKSAQLAAKHGLPYAVGHFMNNESSKQAADTYLSEFKPSLTIDKPQLIVCVSVFCAPSIREAEAMALSSFIWSLQKDKGEHVPTLPTKSTASSYTLNETEMEKREAWQKRQMISTPQTIKTQLQDIATEFQADECMLLTNVHSFQDRLQSYRLIAEAIL